jgi:hypothetical protein
VLALAMSDSRAVGAIERLTGRRKLAKPKGRPVAADRAGAGIPAAWP